MTKPILLAAALAFTLAIAAVAGISLNFSGTPAQAQDNALPAPTNVQAANGASSGAVAVYWEAVANAPFYRIGWVAYDDVDAAQAAGRDWLDAFAFSDVANRGQTSHTLKRLTPCIRYAFIAASLNRRFGDASWSQWALLTPRNGSDSCPTPAATATPTPTPTGTDYDTDQDGLIDISNLAQLAAIRADLNGDGISPAPAYAAAFPNAMPGMGCPDDGCIGYELTANLDFDTNGSGAPDAGDAYWNNGAGWTPIGDDGHEFTADFDGNNHTIANLYINRSYASYAGLFGVVSGGSIKRVGLVSAVVYGNNDVGGLLVGTIYYGVISDSYATGAVSGSGYVGGLVGSSSYSTITDSYATGDVSGSRYVGGLVGFSDHSVISDSYATGNVSGGYAGGLVGFSDYSVINGSYAAGNVSGGDYVGGLVGSSGYGSISGSYATGAVSGSRYVGGLVGSVKYVGYNDYSVISGSYAAGNVSGANYVGGLVGMHVKGFITASYAVGQVSASGDTSYIGGLVGYDEDQGGDISASYWDMQTTGQAGSYGGVGKTTAELQSPVGYAGIYADWNADLDDDGADDDPWHFGNSRQYPALQYASLDAAAQRLPPSPIPAGTVDYDSDKDGLIEISNLSQLAAIRADLNGDGISPAPAYAAAFPNAMPGMGCPAACTGYELIANLDFDTNGNSVADAGDSFWNKGAGWIPVGDDEVHAFTADFDGNNHTIANLYINRSDAGYVGLFGYASGGGIKRIGLVSAVVSGYYYVGGLAGVSSDSAISNSYATGAISGSGSNVGGLVGRSSGSVISGSYAAGSVSGSGNVGGLVGFSDYSAITASYAAGSVSGGGDVGGLVGESNGAITASYATGGVSGKYESVGGLVGESEYGGTITASYATGSVSGRGSVGGLVGANYYGGAITVSYAAGSVSGSGDGVGGLVGWNYESRAITASYATGTVSGNGSNVGGLVGYDEDGEITASYWDTETTGQAGSYGGVGKTTAELQSPTDYAGIYAEWNLDLDDDGRSDNPWHFGNSRQYPALQYASLDPAAQRP